MVVAKTRLLLTQQVVGNILIPSYAQHFQIFLTYMSILISVCN